MAGGAGPLVFGGGAVWYVDAAADFLRLLHAAERPAILERGAVEVFETAQALGSIGAEAAEDFMEAAHLWRNLWGLAQLAADGELVEDATGSALAGAIGRSGGKLVLEALSRSVEEVSARAAGHVDALFAGAR
ncbi:MAG: hypothetical protein F4X35_02000 [Alphaproteobacteria bacterium]|nr:hypothetical protein [Alphaproteobacteria bacterium]